MKILFVVKFFPVVSETFIVNQIVYLLKQGHDIRILSQYKMEGGFHKNIGAHDLLSKASFTDEQGGKPQKLYSFFAKFIYLLVQDSSILKNCFKFIKGPGMGETFKLMNYACAFLKFNKDFDVVHAHFGPNSQVYFDLQKINLLKKAKLITSFHGYDMQPIDKAENRVRYRDLFANNITLTTNNKYGKHLLLKIKPGYPHIELLPVGLDTSYFQPRPSGKNAKKDFQVMFCGRFVEMKAPELVVEVAKILILEKDIRDIKFVMVGDGALKSEVESRISNYKLEGYFDLKGFLKQEEIIELLQESDAFLMPGRINSKGRGETQGLVIQEAQAMEVPVLVSDVAGAKYGVKNGETGYIVPSKDLKGFADHIQKLYENPRDKELMGKRGRQYVQKHFDSDRLGQALVEIYNSVLESK
jgi:colanic acid/amylovoran biosynthesis glycosyltransferase